MGNYNPTGPWTNGSSPGISANFLDNVENVFVEPSGGTESGGYFLAFSPFAVSTLVSSYYSSLSRTSTPVSCSTPDTTDGNSNGTAPLTNHLTSKGVLVYCYSTTSGTGANVNVGGGFTLQY